MPLSAGDKLGPYEIVSLLGKGGMGEVYRAKDTRLKREVAVKVIPEAFANDRERMARFRREAEILASLNHPNIAQIYQIEEGALVMELVRGEPLKGPLLLATALNYAKQIAEALEAAHEKGIIHRDLKPGNIIITPEGVAKVLDFGLADGPQRKSSEAIDPADSTLTEWATQAGLVLGTASYMSPEQAAGKAVDRRADVWSFGAVLFEMLTGRRLFRGDTVAHTLADVLTGPIDLSRVPEATPSVVRELLRRCLNREFKMRLSHIAEARILLEEYLANPAQEGAPTPVAHKPGWVAGAAALACVAAVALFGWWKAARPLERPLVHLDVNLGAEYSGGDVILSPDGARLVFVSKGRLFTRRLNQSKANELPGTEGAYGPFFSPDGQWVAFFGGGKLKKTWVEGGAVIALCDAPAGRGGAWGEDHSILAALTANRSSLLRIPDAGGTPQVAIELAQDEILQRWPQILPGGKAVLFTATTTTRGLGGFDDASIKVMTFQDRRRKTLHRGTYGRYLPTATGAGHLVYINKGTLFAVPFSLDTLEMSGTPVPVLHKVAYSANSGSAQFDFSRDGKLVYRSSSESESGKVTLQWLSGGGKLQSLPAQPGIYSQPRLSPDGKLVALTGASETGTDIWIYDWQRDAMARLTFGNGSFAHPVWSPDGRSLVFRADSGIFWARADGAGQPQPLTRKPGHYPWSFSPDAKRLAFAETGAGDFDLWTVPVENDSSGLRAGKAEVFLQTPENESYPAYSPDGRWIAYRSVQGGRAEIYVRAFPDTGGKWQISNGESILAIWSPKGRELFYLTAEQQIMVVSYTTRGNSFMPDKPRLWSEKRLAVTGFQQNLDISPDGKRFIVLMPSEALGANNQVTFLQNFFDEVRRLVAAGQ